jgi:hypothetical protein
MIIGVIIAMFVVYLKTYGGPAIICQQSTNNLWLSFAIYLSFAALFMNFFYRAYMVKRKKHGDGSNATPIIMQNGTAKEKHA